MKDFNEIKIVACFMVHDENPVYLKYLLDDLSRLTDEFYVNFNEPTDIAKEMVLTHPKLKKYIFTENGGKWNQGLQRTNTIRLLDEVRPDIVLFPDTDEVYPKNIKELLKEFWEDEEKLTMWFRLYYMWDSERTFRNDGIWKSIHHVRAYRWREGLTYRPYRGYAVPTEYSREPRNTRFNSLVPIKHFGYMMTEDRQKKFLRANQDYSKKGEEIDKNKIILELPIELY